MNSDIFYIIAPGPTLNDLTEEEWKFLEHQNTISISCTPFTGKYFKYYMTYESTKSTNRFLEMMAEDRYFNTTLLLGIDKNIRYALELGFKNIYGISKGRGRSFNGKLWFDGEDKPPEKLKNCIAQKLSEPLFRYRGSLAATINVALILGAKEIRLIGVELNNMKHFYEGTEERWTKDPKRIEEIRDYHKDYLETIEVKKRRQVERMKDFDPNIMHTTAMKYPSKLWGNKNLIGMPKVVEWMDKELREMGHRGIYITNKKSILYKDNLIEYKKVME